MVTQGQNFVNVVKECPLRENSGCKIEFATEPKFSRIEFEGKDFSGGKREVTMGPNQIWSWISKHTVAISQKM